MNGCDCHELGIQVRFTSLSVTPAVVRLRVDELVFRTPFHSKSSPWLGPSVSKPPTRKLLQAPVTPTSGQALPMRSCKQHEADRPSERDGRLDSLSSVQGKLPDVSVPDVRNFFRGSLSWLSPVVELLSSKSIYRLIVASPGYSEQQTSREAGTPQPLLTVVLCLVEL